MTVPPPVALEELTLAVLEEAVRSRDVTLHDLDRLAAVQRLVLSRPDAEALVGDLLRCAAERLQAGTAMLSVVLDDMHLVIAEQGLEGWVAEARAFPADWSFCAETVRRGAPLVLQDTAADPVHADSPVVAVDGIRTYAGAPLRTSDGLVLGALCVVGGEPREWTAQEVAVLEGLADEAVRRYEGGAAGEQVPA